MHTLPQTLKSFLSYLKNPHDRPATERFGDFDSKSFFHLLLITIISVMLVLPLLAGIESYFELDLGDHKVIETLKKERLLAVTFMVIIGPCIEELLFRYWITFRRAFFLHWTIGILTSIFKVSRFRILRKEKVIWEKYFSYLFYTSAVLFALVHISNFTEYQKFWWLAPLYTLPQLIVGLVLGYIRIKQGFLSAWFFHGCYNLVLVVPFLLFGDQ